MAFISSICSFSLSLKPHLRPTTLLSRDSVSFAVRSRPGDRSSFSASMARVSMAKSDGGGVVAEEDKKVLDKDPRALWWRYVDWLYQHKELGLYSDVSQVGFINEFVAETESQFQATFKAMEELEKGAIVNPDVRAKQEIGTLVFRSPTPHQALLLLLGCYWI